MGTGHVMRCLALAQAWQDAGGQVVYAMAAGIAGVEARLRAESIEVLSLSVPPGSPEDAAATARAAHARRAAWLVLDGYHFDGRYQRAIHEAGLHLLALDDYGHAEHYWADLVLNQDLNAEEGLYYRREPYTKLLLGTQYVLLRREFLRAARPVRDIPERAGKLLVTLGGADPDNVTKNVLRALGETGRGLSQFSSRGLSQFSPDENGTVPFLETVVLVGPGNPHWSDLQAEVRSAGGDCPDFRAGDCPNFRPTKMGLSPSMGLSPWAAGAGNVRLLRDPPNIPELMAWCDLAVTAGGSTLWELAHFGVPSIVLILADNQRPSARLLAERGACLLLGEARQVGPAALSDAIRQLACDGQARAGLSGRIAAIVDGRGAARVCAALATAAATLPASEGRPGGSRRPVPPPGRPR